jgi:hypothetical protein
VKPHRAPPFPTWADLAEARRVFRKNEKFELFYKAARELVDLSLNKQSSLKISEALAVLLQIWNQAFYRFHRFDEHHLAEIEQLVVGHEGPINLIRKRGIESFNQRDYPLVETLFRDFERVLGPVGAAKSLHLLAPGFFPLWDRAIAQAYGVPIEKRGQNTGRYLMFMEITQNQVRNLQNRRRAGEGLLKLLDEYNYSKYTKRWL